MRFSTVFSALAVAVSGAMATATFTSESVSAGFNAQNYYGAPIPPWEKGHHPGWYYGHGIAPIGITYILGGVLCDLFSFLHLGFYCPTALPPRPPHSPPYPPPPEYSQVFYDLTCAVQDGSYQTYGYVDTVEECQAMCDSVAECTFFNTYYDSSSAAEKSAQLTCALFTKCLTESYATYCSGDYITSSAGYCKKTPTPYY
ncbi:hypothetical protein C8R44DRAFT_871727 [Mycena epipterygia]|nr:hypothetical protein C8R44DRAFT_871727 [Mycena epipterygia]